MSSALNNVRDLILVAGHAPFKETTEACPAQPGQDDPWVLQPFQKGEPPLYIAHIRRGVDLLAANPEAMLIFSGGFTRREAGLRWSEADTYRAIARRFAWWMDGASDPARSELDARTAIENFSRDSFENLLFSLCQFQQVVGRYPREVTVVSWAFKHGRFDLHREAIRFPSDRFHFDGFNEPLGLQAALEGEAVTLSDFKKNRFGSEGRLAKKRAARNPFQRQHDFRTCPSLREFFDFIGDPATRRQDFPRRLPWED